MAALPIHKCRLACDTCGREHAEMYDDATAARIAASREGWRFIQYTRRLGGSHKQKGPRTWDACPDCEIPPTVEDAYAVARSRAAQAGSES